MTTVAVTLLAVGALAVIGIYAVLFWWRRGPGRDPRFQHPPGEPRALPGPFKVWQLAFAISAASPPVVFVAMLRGAGTSAADAALWAVAVLVASQLLLFAAAYASWRIKAGRTNAL